MEKNEKRNNNTTHNAQTETIFMNGFRLNEISDVAVLLYKALLSTFIE